MYESEDENFISSINYHISVVVIFSYGIVSCIGVVGNCINLWLCLNPRFPRDAMGYFNILMSVFNIFSSKVAYDDSIQDFFHIFFLTPFLHLNILGIKINKQNK